MRRVVFCALFLVTVAITAIAPASAKDPVGSRSNPVRFGVAAKTEDGWVVKVTKVTPAAWPKIRAENQFNNAPKAGTTFYMVTVSLTYRGKEESSVFLDGSLKGVGKSNVAYSTFDPGCGVLPNALPVADTFKGGKISGNLCWQVKKSDVASLVMYHDGFLSSKKFFALKR